MWLTPSIVTVYLGFYLFIVFISLSIACGLYYLAELIEEFTLTTKRILSHAIKAELLLHLILLIDRLPFICLALGFGSHIAYVGLLKRFPYMQVTSSEGLISVSAFLVSNAAWLRYYWKTNYTVEYIAAFLAVTTWLVPFGFFLGMAGDQAVLPGAGGYPYSASSGSGALPSGSEGQGKQHRGLALRIFDVLKRKRDEVLPDMLSKMPASSGLMPKEKI